MNEPGGEAIGNPLSLVYHLSPRTSLDLDFLEYPNACA